MSTRHSGLVLGSLRERGTIVVVGALCATYATVLLMASGTVSAATDPEGRDAASVALTTLSALLIGIALYVAVVVITGGTATVIAGRAKAIATLRLLGGDARSLRATVARGCAEAAAVGGLVGIVFGHIIAWGGRAYLVSRGTFPDYAYSKSHWGVVPASIAIVAAAFIAGRLGSRRVLSVAPAAALGGMTATEVRQARRLRTAISTLVLLAGVAMMVLGCVRGESNAHTATAPLWAFGGCALVGIGVLVGAPFIVPRCVRALARLLGNAPDARIARRNAVADPMRTSRSTLGLILGAGLITSILSGTAAVRAAIPQWDLSPGELITANRLLSVMSSLMVCIVAISSVIAAVGFVSTMSLVVIQRRRELGLLRALGLTPRQVTSMVTKESLAMGLTAVMLGMALGVAFGSVTAQAMLGTLSHGFVWGVPVGALVAITVCGLALVLLAALPPARRATKVTPVQALRIAD